MDKQFLQGSLTYVGIAISGVSYVLDHFHIVVTGYDSVTVAGVLVGLGVAIYGRIRRELRPDGT